MLEHRLQVSSRLKGEQHCTASSSRLVVLGWAATMCRGRQQVEARQAAQRRAKGLLHVT